MAPLPQFYYDVRYPDIRYNGPLETFYKNIEPYERLQNMRLERESARQMMNLREKQSAREEARLGMEKERFGLERERAGRESAKFEKDQARDAEYQAIVDAAGNDPVKALTGLIPVTLKHQDFQGFRDLSAMIGQAHEALMSRGQVAEAQKIQDALTGFLSTPETVAFAQKALERKQALEEVPLKNLELRKQEIEYQHQDRQAAERRAEARADRAEAQGIAAAEKAEYKAMVTGATHALKGVADTYRTSLRFEDEAAKLEQRAKLAEIAAKQPNPNQFLATELARRGLVIDMNMFPQGASPAEKAAILRAAAEDARNKARETSRAAAEQMDEVRTMFNNDQQILGEAALSIPERLLPSTLVRRTAPRGRGGVSTSSVPTVQRGVVPTTQPVLLPGIAEVVPETPVQTPPKTNPFIALGLTRRAAPPPAATLPLAPAIGGPAPAVPLPAPAIGGQAPENVPSALPVVGRDTRETVLSPAKTSQVEADLADYINLSAMQRLGRTLTNEEMAEAMNIALSKQIFGAAPKVTPELADLAVEQFLSEAGWKNLKGLPGRFINNAARALAPVVPYYIEK